MEFLNSPEKFNAAYARVLCHRIRAKTAQRHKGLDLFSGSGARNCNGVTEFRNGQQNQISTIQAPIVKLEWAEPDLNRRPLARKASELSFEDQNELLIRFKDFQMVDLRRSKRTAYEKVWFIKRLLKNVNKNRTEISRSLRGFLEPLENYSAATYKNALMAIKVFFRDYLERPELVSSFKFPHQVFKPKHIVSRAQVKQFYLCLESPKEKALFMLYVTTGLRREEILSLRPEDVDFKNRMITPNNHLGETKKSLGELL